jgi:hypothetical protein
LCHLLSFEKPPMSERVSWLEPGLIVEETNNPDWGLGQVQSVIGDRVTVVFEHAGKIVFRGELTGLVPVSTNWLTKS